MGWGLGGEHLNPSPGDVELARLSWLLAPGCAAGEAAGPCCCCDGAWCVFFFLFSVCYFFASVSCSFPALLALQCRPCFWSPPPPCSILALVCLAHPSCTVPAVPHLLSCPTQPSSSSSSSQIPRKQPICCALKTVGLGKGSEGKR